jgi:hypothetical protein
MRAAETLTLSVLLDAILQAATAVVHANWQRSIASTIPSRTPTNVSFATDATVVAIIADTSLRSCVMTLEALLTTWLSHAVAFPILRLSTEETTRITSDVDVIAAFDFSPFSASLCDRIREVTKSSNNNGERDEF